VDLGLFIPPYHPTDRSIADSVEWDLSILRHADALGYREAWIGQHYTVGWENCAAPDIMIAQALRETSRIVLAPGAHILPYHHPAELAQRVAYLDQLAQGRYMLGVGAGAFKSDAALFGLSGADNQAMMLESLEIMRRLWAADEPFAYEGRFWNAGFPSRDEHLRGPWLKPFQRPHPPIGIAGFSPNSSTLRTAGELGAFPLSVSYNAEFLRGHWAAFSAGAAAGGHVADRAAWRVAAHAVVAETDAEAMEYAVAHGTGWLMNGYQLANFRRWGVLEQLVPGADAMTDDQIIRWMAEHRWFVGSVETVADRILADHDAAGGFGVLLVQPVDSGLAPARVEHSLTLLAQEVLPRVNARLTPR
jgi:alkanesulfonate monooxygenase SsuD/methylene tetrahydromethanopterin reductase-like flavin-dependent oxidoreductase (luciferase family)